MSRPHQAAFSRLAGRGRAPVAEPPAAQRCPHWCTMQTPAPWTEVNPRPLPSTLFSHEVSPTPKNPFSLGSGSGPGVTGPGPGVTGSGPGVTGSDAGVRALVLPPPDLDIYHEADGQRASPQQGPCPEAPGRPSQLSTSLCASAVPRKCQDPHLDQLSLRPPGGSLRATTCPPRPARWPSRLGSCPAS